MNQSCNEPGYYLTTITPNGAELRLRIDANVALDVEMQARQKGEMPVLVSCARASNPTREDAEDAVITILAEKGEVQKGRLHQQCWGYRLLGEDARKEIIQSLIASGKVIEYKRYNPQTRRSSRFLALHPKFNPLQ